MASEYYVYNTVTETRVSRAVPQLAEAMRLTGLLNKTMPLNFDRPEKVYGVEEVDFTTKHTLKIHRIGVMHVA